MPRDGLVLVDVEPKLVRVSQQIDALESEIAESTRNNQTRFPTNYDEKERAYFVWMQLDGQWLVRVGILTGEILHNLRSALDYLAKVLVRTHGGKPTPKTQFPLFTEPPKAQKSIIIHGGISRQSLVLLDELQPYNATDPPSQPLAVLQDLNNVDKHRTLLMVDGGVTNFQSSLAWGPTRTNILHYDHPASHMFSNTVSIQIFALADHPEIPADLFAPDRVDVISTGTPLILLNDGAKRGEPLIDVLRLMEAEVRRVVTRFDALYRW
jgi:hypothetical protein